MKTTRATTTKQSSVNSVPKETKRNEKGNGNINGAEETPNEMIQYAQQYSGSVQLHFIVFPLFS